MRVPVAHASAITSNLSTRNQQGANLHGHSVPKPCVSCELYVTHLLPLFFPTVEVIKRLQVAIVQTVSGFRCSGETENLQDICSYSLLTLT